MRFLKLAFSYEQWEVLDTLVQPSINLLETRAQMVQSPVYLMTLELLIAMEPFYNPTNRRHNKKGVACNEGAFNDYSQGNHVFRQV